MLVKGVVLFLALGLVSFALIMAVEYYLWLNSNGRLILLLVLVGIELFLMFRYILTPLFYLFKLKKGITYKQASLLIGKHFPEVNDKLYNLLELLEDKNRSELLLASIEQRSYALSVVPFAKAVAFKDNLKYLKYLLVPLSIFLFIVLSGNLSSFFGSANRVVNYNMAYDPPAPFQFKILNKELRALDTKSFTVQLTTVGEVRPDVVSIIIEGKETILPERDGILEYTFNPPLNAVDFYFSGSGIKSMAFKLEVVKTPAIQDFRLTLVFPEYTNRPAETLVSSGNATFPEGTSVFWEIVGQHTDDIRLVAQDTSVAFAKTGDRFELTKKIFDRFPYNITTSNSKVRDYEKLEYRFDVIKDAFPTIKAKEVIDTLNPNIGYYLGEATDDYILKSIKLVYYPSAHPEALKSLMLEHPDTNFKQFYYTFPSGLDLTEGEAYSFYFEATDNDAIHNGKSTKSEVFSLALLNQDQLRERELATQQLLIERMDQSLEGYKEQKETLKSINQAQKERNQLKFNDQQEIRDFLKKQQQQEGLMEKFSKELRENLEKGEEDDKLNQLLRERLERQEMEARKNERLMEELNKVADKINKEELTRRLDDIGKQQQNNQRSLEQLLELTKRYYVSEKAAQLSKEMEKLAVEQEEMIQKPIDREATLKEQEKLNEAFKKMAEELEELEKDNRDLKKPLSLDIKEEKLESVKADQKEAVTQMERTVNGSPESKEKEKTQEIVSKKQKAAAKKIQEISEALGESASGGAGGSSKEEDAEMLRQILDNLITFSFKQEALFESLEKSDPDAPQFTGRVREQKELRELFGYVDDSLFALSLRQAEVSEFVNEQITEVYYNIDKSLESIADNQLYQGVSYQKYVLNASNSLADFLANLLDNMQQSMKMGQGSGESKEGFQLPDIIKAQGELKEKMEGMGQSGKGKQENGQGEAQKGKGQAGGEGDKGNQGEKGDRGENGSQGNGKMGPNGSDDGAEGNEGQGQDQPSEAELQEIFEIYKHQQQLRQDLEEQLQDMINSDDRNLGEKILRQMEDFENELLENGITNRGMSKINTIRYELLKLENATMKQGKKPERESNTNRKAFQNPITTKPLLLENYRNEVEILQRQALPLRQNYQLKVKEYFKSND
jgi:hypothetical protein